MSPRIATLPPSRCAKCGEPLGGIIVAFLGGCQHHRIPIAGDVTMCPECGEILAFDDNLQLQRIKPEQIEHFRKHKAEFYAQVERLSAVVRAAYCAQSN